MNYKQNQFVPQRAHYEDEAVYQFRGIIAACGKNFAKHINTFWTDEKTAKGTNATAGGTHNCFCFLTDF